MFTLYVAYSIFTISSQYLPVHTKDAETMLMRVHNLPKILVVISQIRLYLSVPEVIAIIIMYLPGVMVKYSCKYLTMLTDMIFIYLCVPESWFVITCLYLESWSDLYIPIITWHWQSWSLITCMYFRAWSVSPSQKEIWSLFSLAHLAMWWMLLSVRSAPSSISSWRLLSCWSTRVITALTNI